MNLAAELLELSRQERGSLKSRVLPRLLVAGPRLEVGGQRLARVALSLQPGHLGSGQQSSGSEAGSYLRLIDLCITQL